MKTVFFDACNEYTSFAIPIIITHVQCKCYCVVPETIQPPPPTCFRPSTPFEFPFQGVLVTPPPPPPVISINFQLG